METNIEVESANGVREVSIYTHHLMKRHVYISGEINQQSADEFLAKLQFLEEEPDKPVLLMINSQGGEVNAGLAMYDLLQATPLTVYTYCYGRAASMAAILLAGGQKGRRFILPNSEVMIHEPLIAGGLGGSATSIHNLSESILKTRDKMNGILAKHTGKSILEINTATSFDHYMSAGEAVQFGICDAVRERPVMEE